MGGKRCNRLKWVKIISSIIWTMFTWEGGGEVMRSLTYFISQPQKVETFYHTS